MIGNKIRGIIWLVIIIILSAVTIMNATRSNLVEPSLKIPSMMEIKKNGYPKNTNGETYGPDIKELSIEPDLILVENAQGEVGYVKQIDLDDGITLLEEAINKERTERRVPMYSQDGETIIGEYVLGGGKAR